MSEEKESLLDEIACKRDQIAHVEKKEAEAHSMCDPDLAHSYCAPFRRHLSELRAELAELENRLATL